MKLIMQPRLDGRSLVTEARRLIRAAKNDMRVPDRIVVTEDEYLALWRYMSRSFSPDASLSGPPAQMHIDGVLIVREPQ